MCLPGLLFGGRPAPQTDLITHNHFTRVFESVLRECACVLRACLRACGFVEDRAGCSAHCFCSIIFVVANRTRRRQFV